MCKKTTNDPRKFLPVSTLCYVLCMSIMSLLGILSVVNENSCFVDAQKSQTTLLRRRDRETRNKFEKNHEPHRLQTIEPIEEGSGDDKALSLDAGKLSQIKDEYTLKQNANLEIQKIPYKIMSLSSSEQEEQTNKIKIDGEEFSLEGASPFNIFSSDAKYLIDGIEQPKLPTVNTFTKVYQDNSIVLITREDLNEQKKITSISYYGPGKSVDLVNINPMQDDLSKEDDAGIFVTIQQDDIDFDKLNHNFRFADRLNDGDEDQEQDIEEDELAQFFFDPHRLKKQKERFQDEKTGKDYDNRNRDRDLLTLQYSSQEDFFNSDNVCFSYKEIEIAVAFDTSFCVEHGGSQRATNEIQRILSGISIRYQQNGLCAYIKATHIEGYCTIASDPYKSMIASNLSGCGSIGLLDKFQVCRFCDGCCHAKLFSFLLLIYISYVTCLYIYSYVNILQDYWNMFRRTIRRDTAHMFSGTGLECDGDGCVIGCANVRCLCSDEGKLH